MCIYVCVYMYVYVYAYVYAYVRVQITIIMGVAVIFFAHVAWLTGTK